MLPPVCNKVHEGFGVNTTIQMKLIDTKIVGMNAIQNQGNLPEHINRYYLAESSVALVMKFVGIFQCENCFNIEYIVEILSQ